MLLLLTDFVKGLVLGKECLEGNVYACVNLNIIHACLCLRAHIDTYSCAFMYVCLYACM